MKITHEWDLANHEDKRLYTHQTKIINTLIELENQLEKMKKKEERLKEMINRGRADWDTMLNHCWDHMYRRLADEIFGD